MPRIPNSHAMLLAAAILALALAPAAVGAEVPTDAVVVQADPPAETDRWWGVLGAALCGIEARLALKVPAIGFNPYVMAAGIGGCLLAAIDVLTTE